MTQETNTKCNPLKATLLESGSGSNVQRNPNGKLILYLIGHGPDAKYLDRLLGQLKGHIEALAFVNTDDTDDCRKVITKHGIPFEYDCVQFSDRKDFDFSLCRNRALKLAKGLVKDEDTWLLWLDCDDVVCAPESILEAIRGKDAVAFAFPYDVSAATDNIRKIRVHKPEEWKWINKVHEELVHTTETQPSIAYCPSVVVQHKPDEDKSNHDFHISLLQEGCRNAPNEYAYIGKEYFNRLQFDEALPWLLKAAAIHDWPNEVYQSWLYAGYIALNHLKDADKAEEWLTKASQVLPQRREAWYFLAQLHARKEDVKSMRKALAYVSCCNAQIDEHQAMQHKGIYERDGYLLHAEILLKYGLKKQARSVLDKVKEHDAGYQELAAQC